MPVRDIRWFLEDLTKELGPNYAETVTVQQLHDALSSL
jgi:hypothetical protein